MSDIILSSAVKTQITLQSVSRAVVDRLRRDETGQDLIEYAGILAVVAVIIGALITLAPGVKTAITNAVNSIIKG